MPTLLPSPRAKVKDLLKQNTLHGGRFLLRHTKRYAGKGKKNIVPMCIFHTNAAGFEPTRAMPKRFLVLRLNHSAKHPANIDEILQKKDYVNLQKLSRVAIFDFYLFFDKNLPNYRKEK